MQISRDLGKERNEVQAGKRKERKGPRQGAVQRTCTPRCMKIGGEAGRQNEKTEKESKEIAKQVQKRKRPERLRNTETRDRRKRRQRMRINTKRKGTWQSLTI